MMTHHATLTTDRAFPAHRTLFATLTKLRDRLVHTTDAILRRVILSEIAVLEIQAVRVFNHRI